MTEVANPLTNDDYDKLNEKYKQFYEKSKSNGKIKIKDLGTDIFYYKDGKHDEIFDKYKPSKIGDIKLKTRQNFINLYDELLQFGDNLQSDNYVVIDISGICNNSNEPIVNKKNEFYEFYKNNDKILECNSNNVFGIEYMLKRYYIKQKNLQIYNNEFFFNVNSWEAFEEIFFDKLIDDLFNPDMYIGEGRGTDNTDAKADLFNTNLNITNRLNFYIINIYNKLLYIYNNNSKYITYNEGEYVKVNGLSKKIFAIGDIHGDFPRLIQILYNAGFIGFEGVNWNKVNLADENSYKTYLHSTYIFKEIKWIPIDTLLLFTGDLIDSTGRYINIDADDETGDYELRIHVMILILRKQAMQYKNSFIHYVMGNHDHDMTQYVAKNASSNSLNKLFNSYQNRNYILNCFHKIYKTYYLLINFVDKKNIVLAHGSFEITRDDDLNEEIKLKKNHDGIDTSLFYNRNIIYTHTIYNNPNNIIFNDATIDLLKINMNILQKISKSKIPDTILLLETLNNKKESIITLINNNPDKYNFIIQLLVKKDNLYVLKENLTDDQLGKIIDLLFENIKYVSLNDLNNYKSDNFYSYGDLNNYYIENIYKKFLSELNITAFIFGHSISNSTDYPNLAKMVEFQTGKHNCHTILSSCDHKCYFIDTGLSKAFDSTDKNNEFYELLSLNKDNNKSAHLRVYTNKNRFILGSRKAELFYSIIGNNSKFVPVLEDKGVLFEL